MGMLVVIRGAGDIASGIAIRLVRAGMRVVMCDIARPTSIRRTVCFSEAIREGSCTVEDVVARLAQDPAEARAIAEKGEVAVLVDPEAACVRELRPDALVDAILAKRNLGTTMDMAPVVVGVGPGFTAQVDCHAAVETMRGHHLGRVYYEGSPIPNTNVPGLIGGFAGERVMRAPADGIFEGSARIGDVVSAGDVVGRVGDAPMRATIDGVVRGLLATGVVVRKGMKAGDVDPRCKPEYCELVSDKALAVGGGVLEAILALGGTVASDRFGTIASDRFVPNAVREEEPPKAGQSSDVRLTKLAECAGCGAKVGAGQLAKLLSDLPLHRDPNLLVGFDKSDDAAVYRIADDLALVETVDFFPPIADDPYAYGAIAAANALSDVYAMGGEPRVALNVMAVPEDMPQEVVHQILRGGYEKVFEAGASIVGGHSIYDDEPKYGLAVTGVVDPARMLTNAGARPGDVLVYTKPLGIGCMVTAAKGGIANEAQVTEVNRLMMTLNRYARNVMVAHDVHACTDVTGFGMLGHLLEMAQGADVAIELVVGGIRLVDGARDVARLGILPAGMYRNRHFAEAEVDTGDVPLDLCDVLFCPETSGGLMIAVAPEDADALVAGLLADARVPAASVVGRVVGHDGGKRIRLRM